MSSLQKVWLSGHKDADVAVFVVWSSQLGGTERFARDARKLMPDPRTTHYWDGNRTVGNLFRTFRLGDDTLRTSAAAWDTYLLFGRSARWPAGGVPPRPAWWEHQLGGMPPERRLDVARFARQAMRLGMETRTGGR